MLAVDSPARLWLLFTVLFLYGAACVVVDAAESALVAAAVAPELLGDFNGLRMTLTEGMKLVAPPTGAVVYAAQGGHGVALLDAATFVCAAGLYGCVTVREERPRRTAGHWRAHTAEGARFLWAHPGLRPLVAAGGATMLCAGLGAPLVYAVVEGLGHSPRTRARCTPPRAPVRSWRGCSRGPRCGGWGRAGSRRAGSPSRPRRSPPRPSPRRPWP